MASLHVLYVFMRKIDYISCHTQKLFIEIAKIFSLLSKLRQITYNHLKQWVYHLIRAVIDFLIWFQLQS